MSTMGQILHLEDNPYDAELIAARLQREGSGFQVTRVDHESAFREGLSRPDLQLILADMAMPSFDGYQALAVAREQRPDLPFIFVSGALGEETAIETLKSGATDYVLKSRLDRLVPAIQRALRERRERHDLQRAEEALRRSEERFRAFMENSSALAFIKDEIGHYIYVNRLFQRLFVSDFESACGKTDFELLPVSVARYLREHDQAVLENDHPAQMVEVVPTPDGVYRHWLVSKFPIHEPTGTRVLGGIGVEITEQTKAERKLKESERRHRLLVESIPEVVWVADAERNTTFIGPNVEQMTGISPERIYEEGPELWFKSIHSEDIWHVQQAYRAFFLKEIPFDVEYRFRRSDGVYIWIHDRAKVQFAENLRMFAYGLLSDITERKRALEKIQEQAALIDKAPAAIIFLDLNGVVRSWNRSAERFFSATAEEAVGRPFTDLVDKTTNINVMAALKQAVVEGSVTTEIHVAAPSGTRWILQTIWSRIDDEKGAKRSLLLTATDVTEKKRMETQYYQAQRMETIGALAGGIAHDLNNVLSPILACVELLRMKMPDAGSQKLLETLENSTHRGASLVKQVLSFARGVEGEKAPVQIIHLFREITKLLKETFPSNIQLQSDFARDLWLIEADSTQLYQVFLNLYVNARDAMAQGGLIRTVAENRVVRTPQPAIQEMIAPGNYVVLSISDTGIGIPRHYVSKIFQPFFTTKETGKGTGLGLATVLAITKAHNGFMQVESEPGRGSTFRVFIPAAAGAERVVPPRETPIPRGNGEWILVVDDEPSISEIARAALEAYGYEVETANDGAEAVAKYVQRRDSIQLVITDMKMPFMDGLTTIRALRKINSRLRIIAASGMGENEELLRSMELRVQAFLHKPYTAPDLAEAVARVLLVNI